jgi:hypothetical protein
VARVLLLRPRAAGKGMKATACRTLPS